MPKRCALLFYVALLALPWVCNAETGQVEHKTFSVGLMGGYTALPMLVLNVDWLEFEKKKREIPSSDDSFVNTAPVAGLSFSYFPSDTFISAGFTVEGLYQKHIGTLKGSVGEIRETRDTYNYHMGLEFYQLNFLCTVFFTKKSFRPYIQAGLGAVRNDAEFGSYKQTVYGASGTINWGAQYYFTDWFALGGQARTQDLFAFTWFFEPESDTLLTIEGQFIPLSFLLHTNFYF